MQDHEVRATLRASLQDGRLDRAERDGFKAWLEASAPDGNKRAVYQSMAFDLAREAIEAKTIPHYSALNWLEKMVKLLTPPASNSPASDVAEACFTPQHDGAARIVRLFGDARTAVDVCVFTITDDRISGAMIAAHRRGVRLRVITDNEKRLDAGSDIARLRQAGIVVREDQTAFHMHHKFALFDQRVLLTGSYNWTRSAALHNEENFILTGDARLVREFARVFEELWAQFGGGR
jgi:phosphatidylserine/phosphatidylglycerophosphate/cardiolipin synthase-like enzyme